MNKISNSSGFKEIKVNKIMLSLALTGIICQESQAITADQIIGGCEVFIAAAGACSVYALGHDTPTPEQTKKIWADHLRKELQNKLGVTMMYEGDVVDIATLTDEQVLAVTGKDKFLSYLPAIKNVLMVAGGMGSIYFALKGIGRLIGN